MRPLTEKKEDILDLAERIRNRGRQEIELLINNTNLAGRTTPEMVERGEKTVIQCAECLGINRIMTSGLTTVLNQCRLQTPAVEIKRYMVPEWMEEQE